MFLRELAVHDLPGNGTLMLIGACEGIMYPLPHHVDNFVRNIKLQELVQETQFDSILFWLAVQNMKQLNWAINHCLS